MCTLAQNLILQKTLHQYDAIIGRCQELFYQKTLDYGTAWRILRPSSLTDQLYIKAKRIRQIETTGEQRVADPVSEEYMGLINYSLLAILQLHAAADDPLELDAQDALERYRAQVAITRQLMIDKNSDYGEVWREMRLSSLTDLILQKLLRVKQIEDNAGRTRVSEGLEANYRDIVNYAVFALIKLGESNEATP